MSPQKPPGQNKEASSRTDLSGGLFFNNSSGADLKPVPQDSLIKADIKNTDPSNRL